mgnify:CR=1 FL=1
MVTVHPKKPVTMRTYKPTYEPHPGQVEKACKSILKAKKPVIYAGGGVINGEASRALTAFAREFGIPVTTTLMGIGSFDTTDPLALHMLGMHGLASANYAVEDCDFLIAVGARFDDSVAGLPERFAPNARSIAQFDIDPSEIGKNVAVDIPIVGDVGNVLRALIKAVPEVDPATRQAYFDELAEWRTESEAISWHGSGCWKEGLLTADYVMQRLGEMTDHDATVVGAVEETARDHAGRVEADRDFAPGIDAEQRHAAAVAGAGHHCRHAYAAGPAAHLGTVHGRPERGARFGEAVLDVGVVAVPRMMYLHVAGKGVDAVLDHLVDHAAHQGRHEDHRPGAGRDRQQHDRRAPPVAPQVSPGQAGQCAQRERSADAHQAVLMASTGRNRNSRRAGYSAASRQNTNTMVGPSISERGVTLGYMRPGRLKREAKSSIPG